MKQSIEIKVCCLSVIMLICTAWVKGGTAENPEVGDIIDVVENTSDQILTISDLYTYSDPYCMGTKTTILAKGDPSDDINIAPGSEKTFYLGQCQSCTYSYMLNGKEVEFDETWDNNLSDQTNAVFDSDYPGLFAIDFSAAGTGPLPPIGIPQLISGGTGHIGGGGYDWIKFYDVNDSDGMIERDPLGNPISPVLPDGISVTLVIGYNVKLFKLVGHQTLSADLSGDGIVNFLDLTIMAEQWLESVPPDISWAYVDDDGSGMKDEWGNPIYHGGFNGYISKYETTNAQYCQFLNAAFASGDIIVDSNGIVYGANGSNIGEDFLEEPYYNLSGSGWTYAGATNGGAARINWTGSSFIVDSGFDNHPVTYVSWYGASAFASYYGLRLPTEWEWQAVADYNGSLTYACGWEISNFSANYFWSTHPCGTTIVGTFFAYYAGIMDMSGNVWEWTSSLLNDSHYDIRGGGWDSGEGSCKVWYRNSGISPDTMYSSCGFRVCR